MTDDLSTQIADAIYEAMGGGGGTSDPDLLALVQGVARDYARIALDTILAQGGVTSDGIAEALGKAPCTCRPFDPDGDDPRERDCPHDGDGDPRNLTPTVSDLVARAIVACAERDAAPGERANARALAALVDDLRAEAAERDAENERLREKHDTMTAAASVMVGRWADSVRDAEARAERAEAERDELRAEVERLSDDLRLAHDAVADLDAALESALDGAVEAPIREAVREALTRAADSTEDYKPWSPLSSNESLLLTYAASMIRGIAHDYRDEHCPEEADR